MTEDEIFFIDTNVLVYAFEREISEKKRRAEEILEKCWKNMCREAVSNQVLAEFSYVMLTKGKLTPKEIEKILYTIVEFKGFLKLEYHPQTITSTLGILQDAPMPFWDALIAATMLENNIRRIYTENTKDFSIAGITAINPFTTQKTKNEPAKS